jgi:sugar phosphate isomerase/epimerase
VLAVSDQTLVGLRAELGPGGLSPGADVDRLIAQLDTAMEAAAGLRANLLTLDLGPLPAAANVPPPKPVVTKEQAGLILIPDFTTPAPVVPAPAAAPADPAFVAQRDAALAELAGRADRYGVIVALGATLASHASLAEAIDRVRCPLFGVEVDPVSVLRDDWTVDEIFSRVGPLIRHVRARDAAVGEAKRTKPMPISRGDTKWGYLLDALREADYSGWITIDPTELPDRLAGAKAAVKYLREVALT